MEEPLHKKGVPTKFHTSEMIKSRATKKEEKIAEWTLAVSTFYFKSVSFSDELPFSEESDKLPLILYVDLERNGLGDIGTFIVQSRSFLSIEVHYDSEIHETF